MTQLATHLRCATTCKNYPPLLKRSQLCSVGWMHCLVFVVSTSGRLCRMSCKPHSLVCPWYQRLSISAAKFVLCHGHHPFICSPLYSFVCLGTLPSFVLGCTKAVGFASVTCCVVFTPPASLCVSPQIVYHTTSCSSLTPTKICIHLGRQTIHLTSSEKKNVSLYKYTLSFLWGNVLKMYSSQCFVRK